jgi:phosphoribosylanthranilate isomerase
VHVKICGLTDLDDALAAAEAGAGLLGFNFYPRSPRYISPQACSRITGRLAARGLRVQAVGVFVNAGRAEIEAIAGDCGLDLLQLHGDESPELLVELGPRAFKAIRPASAADAEALLAHYGQRADRPALLIDAARPGAYGGTGATGDWRLAAAIAQARPVLLAGGLKPDNVAEAIAQVRPWGVDVASGVEDSPGRKDRRQVAAFIAAARQAIEGS